MVRMPNDVSYMSLWTRYIVTLIILTGAVVAWYSFYYSPLLLQEQRAVAMLQSLKKQQQQFYVLHNDVDKLRHGCDSLSNDIGSKLALNKFGSINNLFKNVLKEVSSSDLLLTYCSPQKVKMKKWYKKQPLKFVTAGSFFDCIDLLEKIKNYKFFNKVPQLVIQKKNDILMLECVVQAYTFDE